MKKITFFLSCIVLSLCFAQTGAKYLIITHDNFYNAVQPLAQWKQKKGVPAKTVKLSEIGATPESIARIKNYIVSAYNTWNPQPAYVLLVGSPEYLRSDNNTYDDFFANMSGNYLMELSIGRLPCSTATQCSVIVNKTIAYERTPYTNDTLWYKKGTCIIREDGSAQPDTVYWNDSRYICNLWQNAGYIYSDTFSRLRGDSAVDVITALNDGRSFVSFRGQGVANWWAPFALNPEQLTNGYKQPVVVSATCATLNLTPGGAFLGEMLLRTGTTSVPKGAIGFIGTSISTSVPGAVSALRGLVTKNLFKTIFTENNYRLGDALKRAKFVADSMTLSGWTSTRYREWNLLGDPELPVWTSAPKTLNVTCDTVIPTGSQNFTVTVRHGTTPLQNAVVCIMKDTLIYQYNTTNSSGVVTFSINPQSTGMMSVTVTARNFKPWERNTRIRSSGVEQLSNLNWQTTSNIFYPNPCRNFARIRLTRPLNPDHQILVYDVQGRLVNNIRFDFNNSELNLDKISAGVYMVFTQNDQPAFLGKLIKQ